MQYFDLNAVSIVSGIAAVLCVAIFRLQWPFRYHFLMRLYKNNPDKILSLLERSYQKNTDRTVAILDKSTREIMTGNFDDAESFVAEGLTACTQKPTLLNQALVHVLFYNLAAVYFYLGKYNDALDVALRVFHRDRSFQSALGIIVCSYARMGDIGAAIKAYEQLTTQKPKPALNLFCLSEIEAAKGNYGRAAACLRRLTNLPYWQIMHLSENEIEKRLQEWTKASSQVG